MSRHTLAAIAVLVFGALPAHASLVPLPDLSGTFSEPTGTETIDAIIQYASPTAVESLIPTGGTAVSSGVITAPAPTPVPVTPVIPVDVLSGVNLDLLAPVANANINLNANTNVNVPIRIPWPTGTPAPTTGGEPSGSTEAVGPESPAGSAEAVGPESPAGSAEAVGPESPAAIIGPEWLAAAASMTEPAQLSVFAQTIADADKNVKGISVDGAVLRFSYRQPAKLLGLIPLHYTMTVEYDLRDGQTTYESPWWLVLASDNRQAIREAVSAQLAQLQAIKTLNSLERMAQVMAVLESILHKTGATVGAVVVNVK